MRLRNSSEIVIPMIFFYIDEVILSFQKGFAKALVFELANLINQKYLQAYGLAKRSTILW
jgi:hypothetical protein